MELKKYKRRMNLPKYGDGKWSWLGGNQDPMKGEVVDGFKQRILNAGGNVVTSGVNFAGSAMQAYGPVKSESDLMAESQRSTGYGSGFTYDKIANVDTGKLMSELSAENTGNTLKSTASGAAFGAAVGSIFPGIGTVIGGVAGALGGLGVGLLGSSSRLDRLRRKIMAANRRIENTNTYNLASAQSDYLTDQYNLEHNNTQDDLLYIAKRGKDLKRPIWQ